MSKASAAKVSAKIKNRTQSMSSSPSRSTAAKPRFSKETLKLIQIAGKQKSIHWLEKNREQVQTLLWDPLQALAADLQRELRSEATGYHFPRKGIGRLKRTARSMSDSGSVYKDWIAYSASRPSGSRFEGNPNLFFLINPNDEDGDQVLAAGGLYLPSSRQLRGIRESIARDSTEFKKLFKTSAFAKRFPGGFSEDRKAKRMPRGFDPAHPDAEWLKHQGYFVWRSYKVSEFSSPNFSKIVAGDFKLILKMNRLLDQAVQGKPVQSLKVKTLKPGKTVPLSSSERGVQIAEVSAPARPMDF